LRILETTVNGAIARNNRPNNAVFEYFEKPFSSNMRILAGSRLGTVLEGNPISEVRNEHSFMRIKLNPQRLRSA